MKVGIIGCGLIGNRRANVVHQSKGDELIIVADIDESRAKNLAEEIGCLATLEWCEVVNRNDLDAIIVSTTNNWLAPVTIAALQNGKHVLCEKPPGLNPEEAYQMIEAARANVKKLKIGFNHRYHPAVSKAKDMLDQGCIGKPLFIRCRYGHGGRAGYDKEWRANTEISGGGELLDQGIHAIDLFRWFLGDFQEAFGYIGTWFWNTSVEDNVFAFYRTSGGHVASLHASWTQWKNLFSFEIFGEAGYLIVEGLGGSYGTETLCIGKRKLFNGYNSLVDKDEKEIISDQRITNQLITNNYVPKYAGGPPAEEVIEFPGPDISWEVEWQDFISSIQEDSEPMVNGYDGWQAMRMVYAVYESARTGQVVKL
jgi:predicted dehydrogenase